MNDQQKVREEFEAWARSAGYRMFKRVPDDELYMKSRRGHYSDFSLDDAWIAWQAALTNASSATTNPQESSSRLVDAEDSELLTAYKALMLAVTSAHPVWPNPWPQEVSILGYAIHGLRLDTKYAQDKITALRNRLISERTAFYSPHVHHMEFARASAEADINEFEQAFDQAIAGRRGDGNG